MSGLVILVIAFVGILILELLAQTRGVDSRPDFNDPRSHTRGLTEKLDPFRSPPSSARGAQAAG